MGPKYEGCKISAEMPRLRLGAYTKMEIWPVRFEPQPDMEVINTWPQAWYDTVPRLRQWPDVVALMNRGKRRRTLRFAPPINEMAAVWISYPGYKQGSQGWHNQRFNFIISGSRVGTILGHNPYQSQFVLYDMMIGMCPVDIVNHHMIRGTTYEPVAMRHCEVQNGWVLLDMPLIHHKDWDNYPILVVSLDRLFAGRRDGGGQKLLRLVECKCPWEIKPENVILYNDQMQLQMETATSYLTDQRRKNDCECFLYQYRDSAWSGTGYHEAKQDRVPKDPSWLQNAYPHLLDFDQCVRRSRQDNGITLEVYNKLNRDSLAVYNETLQKLNNEQKVGDDPEQLKSMARQIQTEFHKREYDMHVTAKWMF